MQNRFIRGLERDLTRIMRELIADQIKMHCSGESMFHKPGIKKPPIVRVPNWIWNEHPE